MDETPQTPEMKLAGIVLDSPDTQELLSPPTGMGGGARRAGLGEAERAK